MHRSVMHRAVERLPQRGVQAGGRARPCDPSAEGEDAHVGDAARLRALDDRFKIDDHRLTVNLYEMYVANDMKADFWVKRRTWGDLCARVTFVGELERHGRWIGGAVVRADIFHFVSGELKDADAELPAPGSHKTWQQIPPPPLHAWSRSAKRVAALDTG
ncbi:MAG: hypothetical protein M3Z15_00925, partial [Pseudomonadota bacterium]|nr:hypothetical protein [Pseudomonadota bacterium]